MSRCMRTRIVVSSPCCIYCSQDYPCLLQKSIPLQVRIDKSVSGHVLDGSIRALLMSLKAQCFPNIG